MKIPYQNVKCSLKFQKKASQNFVHWKKKNSQKFQHFHKQYKYYQSPQGTHCMVTQVLGRYPKKSGYQIWISHSISLLIFEMISWLVDLITLRFGCAINGVQFEYHIDCI